MQPWHVLELHRDELKVEFDATEHWMQGLRGDCNEFRHGSGRVLVVGRDDLAALYRRGVEAWSTRRDPQGRARFAELSGKLALLETTA